MRRFRGLFGGGPEWSTSLLQRTSMTMTNLFDICGMPAVSRTVGLPVLLAAGDRPALGVDSQGRFDGALCNCCNDCCFPHQLARERQAEKIWPLIRYLTELASEPCNGCGRCVRRCPFGAISQEKKKKECRPPHRSSTPPCAGAAGSAPPAAPRRPLACRKSGNRYSNPITPERPLSG
jgi:ferredoxin